MFIRLLETAISINDTLTAKFCKEILKVYDKYNINGHIDWKNKNDKKQ